MRNSNYFVIYFHLFIGFPSAIDEFRTKKDSITDFAMMVDKLSSFGKVQ